MNPSCQARLSRAVAWILIVAMLLPTVEGCATMQPSTVILDGIVVNGQRLARPDETGLVWVTRGNLPLQVHAGMELRTGDFVVTGPNAYAVIRYPSGSEMLLRPNSRGRLGSFSEFVGELFVKVKGLQNLKSFFTVETTFVRAGARGTAFLVRTGAGGTTTVIVFDGSVVVDSPANAWSPVTLVAGSMAIAHPTPPRTTQANIEELQRTQEWVERIERIAPPHTGISGAGVAALIGIAVLVGAILSNRPRDPPRPGTSNDSPRR